MTSLRHIVALNIKERRRFLGISQMKLAEKINTAPTYIAMIELEKRSPSFEMIEKIAAALDIDPADLFSKKAHAVDLIKDFHESVLSSFKDVLNSKIGDFENKMKYFDECKQ